MRAPRGRSSRASPARRRSGTPCSPTGRRCGHDEWRDARGAPPPRRTARRSRNALCPRDRGVPAAVRPRGRVRADLARQPRTPRCRRRHRGRRRPRAGCPAYRPEADAIFLACTGVPTIGLLAELTQRFGIPVLSANQVTMWSCKKAPGKRRGRPDGRSAADRGARRCSLLSGAHDGARACLTPLTAGLRAYHFASPGVLCGVLLRADVAQLVEQRFCKPPVPGSSPVVGSN